jgi:hypothetical protein
MIYVDDPFEWQSDDWRKGWWCHMWSDTSTEELVCFARELGLADAWLQYPGRERWLEHYDLRLVTRVVALERGATEIAATTFIRMMRQREP